MSKTYDRVSAQILKDKQRIDEAIAFNAKLREKCINALIEAKEYFDKKLKGNR